MKTHRMKISISLFLCIFAVFSMVLTFSAQAKKDNPVEIRAIWVTRWDYKIPEDVEKIIRNCAENHFNVVLFQVRGNGTAFYSSKIEPWAWELTSDSPATTGQNPGWDPLKKACLEARKAGVELHAYMNVFPAWRSQDYPPASAGQLWTTHPEWFMVDRQGNKMIPRTNWYSFISPGIPEVGDYIESVFLEVVKNYPVDGIHFDYIRYPSEIDDFSYDPISLKRFKQETGKIPQEATEEWNQWRGNQVTQIEQAIYRQTKKINPRVHVSASVVAEPERGYNHYYQQSSRWLKEGTIDIVMPMGYTNDLDVFKTHVKTFFGIRGNHWVAPGIGIGRAREGFIDQVKATRDLGADGNTQFAYSSLFSKHQPNELAKTLKSELYQEKARLPWD